MRRLDDVSPGERAEALAAEHGKDPRHVQVVLDETRELLRAERGVLICVTHHGFVCANAGVDASNAAGRVADRVADPPASRPGRLGPRAARAPARADGRRAGGRDHRLVRARMAPRPDGRRDRRGGDRGARGLARAHRQRRPRAARRPGSRSPTRSPAPPTSPAARTPASRSCVVSGLDRHVLAGDDGPGAAALLRPRGRGPLPLTCARRSVRSDTVADDGALRRTLPGRRSRRRALRELLPEVRRRWRAARRCGCATRSTSGRARRRSDRCGRRCSTNRARTRRS